MSLTYPTKFQVFFFITIYFIYLMTNSCDIPIGAQYFTQITELIPRFAFYLKSTDSFYL